jgi:hypothetical protein
LGVWEAARRDDGYRMTRIQRVNAVHPDHAAPFVFSAVARFMRKGFVRYGALNVLLGTK